MAVFILADPVSVLRAGFPPVEELTVERVTLPEPLDILIDGRSSRGVVLRGAGNS